jgi:hypothetical protein
VRQYRRRRSQSLESGGEGEGESSRRTVDTALATYLVLTLACGGAVSLGRSPASLAPEIASRLMWFGVTVLFVDAAIRLLLARPKSRRWSEPPPPPGSAGRRSVRFVAVFAAGATRAAGLRTDGGAAAETAVLVATVAAAALAVVAVTRDFFRPVVEAYATLATTRHRVPRQHTFVGPMRASHTQRRAAMATTAPWQTRWCSTAVTGARIPRLVLAGLAAAVTVGVTAAFAAMSSTRVTAGRAALWALLWTLTLALLWVGWVFASLCAPVRAATQIIAGEESSGQSHAWRAEIVFAVLYAAPCLASAAGAGCVASLLVGGHVPASVGALEAWATANLVLSTTLHQRNLIRRRRRF